jgi:hypothetical protein
MRFHPPTDGSILDAWLRDDLLPAARAARGIREVLIGRRGTGDNAERIVATVWETSSAMSRAVASLPSIPGIAAPADGDAEGTVQVQPVRLAMRLRRSGGARIIRLFTGDVRDGELDTYVERARLGVLADAAAGAGPLSFYLAAVPPVRFAAVSTWSSWPSIEAATGSSVGRPDATRHADLLESSDVAHYEMLPGARGTTAVRPPRS